MRRHYLKTYSSLLFLALLWPSAMSADSNLSVTNIEAAPGKNIYVPIATDGKDAIVAVQFDVQLPFSKGEGDILLTDRSEDHVASLLPLGGNKYRVLVTSLSNKTLKGESGTLLTIPLIIDDDVEEGKQYAIEVSEVILADVQGHNVCINSTDGVLTIAHTEAPDLTVEEITSGSSTIIPGETMNISWTVHNIGDASTRGGWSEKIYLRDATTEEETFIGTVYCTDDVPSMATLSRTATLALPAVPALDGEVCIKVSIEPNTNTGELLAYRYNNSCVSSQSMTLTRVLTLTAASTTVREGSKTRLTLVRSGNRAMAETATISTGDNGLLAAPSTVILPAGASSVTFDITAVENEVVNSASDETVTVSVNGYAPAHFMLNIEDNEKADFTITTDKEFYVEGEEIKFDITAPRTVGGIQTIHLGVDKPTRVTLPSEIIIPAGETHTTLTVQLADDDRPDDEQTLVFTFAADGYTTSKVPVNVDDNDVPELILTLSPNVVSEAAGPTAIMGVLQRTTLSDRKITMTLSDDSNGQIYYPYTTLTLDKGVETLQFPLGIIDNATVDGDRIVNIRGAIRMSSCNCTAIGDGAGVVTTPITIIDNDGPSLTITTSTSMLLEGHSDAAILTVSRNTAVDTPLSVTLTSDCDDRLSYNHTITLPAGSTSTILSVEALANESSDDDRVVTFTANADGFAKGVCWAMLTDQTLPDAQITAFTLSEDHPEAGNSIFATVTLTNSGAAELSAQTRINIYFGNSTEALATTLLPDPVAPGENVTLQLKVLMPKEITTTEIWAEANGERKVKELLYLNNTSNRLTVTTSPSYSASIHTDAKIYQPLDVIHIEGDATGHNFRCADIEIYVIDGMARDTISTTTDEDGHYTYDYPIREGISGHFCFGACYPGQGLTDAMCEVDVYGFHRKDNGYIQCQATTAIPFVKEIVLSNPGKLSLSGLNVEVLSKPDNVTVDYTVPTTIAADGEATLAITLTGTSYTTGSTWERIVLRVTTHEGPTLEMTLFWYCQNPLAVLTCTTTNIQANVTKGQIRSYPIVLTNKGLGATGPITFCLPEWMGTATSSVLPSLECGDSTTVIFTLSPTDEMPLNVPIHGKIGINCEGGDGISLGYTITPVSELTGSLTIDVVDEYSFYAEGTPHVSGATVTVSTMDNVVVAIGTTDTDGHFEVASIPEGYYILNVTAPKHDSKKCNILIDPGKNNWEEAFLAYQAITYSWNVVETEVEDVYQLKLETVYETQVPKPVVVISIPPEKPEPGDIIDVSVVNKGLVVARDVKFSLNCTKYYDVEYIGPNMMDELLPQMMHVFSVRLVEKKEGSHAKRRRVGEGGGSCFGINSSVSFKSPCGTGGGTNDVAYSGLSFGGCIEPGDGLTEMIDITGIGDGFPMPPEPIGAHETEDEGGKDKLIVEIPMLDQPTDCNSCSSQVTLWALNCAASVMLSDVNAIAGCIFGLTSGCGPEAIEYANHRGSVKGTANCIASLLGCIPGPYSKTRAGIGCLTSIPQCLLDELSTHDDAPSKGRGNIPNGHKAQAAIGGFIGGTGDINFFSGYRAYVVSLELLDQELKATYYYLQEFFGSESWSNCDPHELNLLLNYINQLEDDEITLNDGIRALRPTGISEEELERFVERLYNTLNEHDDDCDNYINMSFIGSQANTIESAEHTAQYWGYPSVINFFTIMFSEVKQFAQSASKSVCAAVKMEIDQTMVMTRQAFRGTLNVSNSSLSDSMSDVKLSLEVTDEHGNIATTHEFQIEPEKLTGFTGNLDLTSGWNLAPGTDGNVTILFIPTRFAAPDEPVVYLFGGTLSYVDPTTGLAVSRPLSPVSLTVNPEPELHLTYFVQRDIMGDNPLTKDVIEPMVPSEFALLINNVGNGDARKVSITTEQPKITENEKGLVIDFEILSSSVNGNDHTLALSRSVPTDFGNIAAHSQRYAQWELQSTLLGHFVKYDASYTHVTSYGNQDLSLVSCVEVHEMIHSLRFVEDGINHAAWIVNDIPDSYDTPDRLYKSDGTVTEIYEMPSRGMSISNCGQNTWALNLHPGVDGWYYCNLQSPVEPHTKLINITRQSDGASIDPQNVWLTSYTLRDGRDPIKENRLHFADTIPANGETYILNFEPTPSLRLAVKDITRPWANQFMLYDCQVNFVDVKFNKSIDSNTFTIDDVELLCQGKKISLAQQVGTSIVKMDDDGLSTYRIQLGSATVNKGYYILSVNTAGITDQEGFTGINGTNIGWTQCRMGQMTETPLYGNTSKMEVSGQLTDDQAEELTQEVSTTNADDVTAIDLRECDNDDIGILEPASPNAIVWAPENMRLGSTRHVVTNGYCTYVGLTDRKSFRPIESFTAGRVDFPFKMSTAGFATLVLPYDCNCPEGLEAYVITHEDEGYAIGEATQMIPAHTPVLLKGEAGNYMFSAIETVISPTDEPADVLMEARYVRTLVPAGNYVLQKQGDRVAFFRVGEGQEFYSDPFRAWLSPTDGSSSALGIRLGGKEVITIVSDDIILDDNTTRTSTDVYDLSGRKVSTVPYQSERMVILLIQQSLPKGIYVVNGKKILN